MRQAVPKRKTATRTRSRAKRRKIGIGTFLESGEPDGTTLDIKSTKKTSRRKSRMKPSSKQGWPSEREGIAGLRQFKLALYRSTLIPRLKKGA